jgi:hypothetical protein
MTRPIGVPPIGDSRVPSRRDRAAAPVAATIASFDIAVEVEELMDISV